ncbi:MAG: hypothetical protein Fur0046_07170 [Cyanobacteria bacterium J069]
MPTGELPGQEFQETAQCDRSVHEMRLPVPFVANDLDSVSTDPNPVNLGVSVFDSSELVGLENLMNFQSMLHQAQQAKNTFCKSSAIPILVFVQTAES